MKKILYSIILLILATALLYAQEEIKPLEINSFPEFFDNIHIGMKSEDVIKALDNRFFLAPASNSITGYNNIEIFRNNTSVIINYKNSKYKSGYLFYSDILFQIGIFKSQEIYLQS